jgi:hypothetical protein
MTPVQALKTFFMDQMDDPHTGNFARHRLENYIKENSDFPGNGKGYGFLDRLESFAPKDEEISKRLVWATARLAIADHDNLQRRRYRDSHNEQVEINRGYHLKGGDKEYDQLTEKANKAWEELSAYNTRKVKISSRTLNTTVQKGKREVQHVKEANAAFERLSNGAEIFVNSPVGKAVGRMASVGVPAVLIAEAVSSCGTPPAITQTVQTPTESSVTQAAPITETATTPASKTPPPPTERQAATATQVATATSTKEPEATPTLTAAQKEDRTKQMEFLQMWYEKNMGTPLDQLNITFNQDGKPMVTDKVTGRLLSIDHTPLFYDPNNTTGIDRLADGTPVFNPKFVAQLVEKGLDKTTIKPTGQTKYPSNEAGAYVSVMYREAGSDGWSQEFGQLSNNEDVAYNPLYLNRDDNGKYSWGCLLYKYNKVTHKRSYDNSYLYYKDGNGDTQILKIYFPGGYALFP